MDAFIQYFAISFLIVFLGATIGWHLERAELKKHLSNEGMELLGNFRIAWKHQIGVSLLIASFLYTVFEIIF